MVGSLNSGVSGMQQFQERMDVIGNNIANVNTVGYKSARVDFADAFSETLQASSGGSATTGSTAAIQVGSGVSTSAVKTQFTQGMTTATSWDTDLAVRGEGFFLVRDVQSDLQYATRAGNFRLDDGNFLVTDRGLRVQGLSDPGLATQGDLQIDGTGRPATASPTAGVTGFDVNRDGTITVHLSDGTHFVRGQLLLQSFRDPQALMKEGSNLYSGWDAAGPLAAAGPPGTNGLGEILQRQLEMSNVDLTNEFAGLITTQRAFQASARIITTSDELLQEVVNLVR